MPAPLALLLAAALPAHADASPGLEAEEDVLGIGVGLAGAGVEIGYAPERAPGLTLDIGMGAATGVGAHLWTPVNRLQVGAGMSFFPDDPFEYGTLETVDVALRHDFGKPGGWAMRYGASLALVDYAMVPFPSVAISYVAYSARLARKRQPTVVVEEDPARMRAAAASPATPTAGSAASASPAASGATPADERPAEPAEPPRPPKPVRPPPPTHAEYVARFGTRHLAPRAGVGPSLGGAGAGLEVGWLPGDSVGLTVEAGAGAQAGAGIHAWTPRDRVQFGVGFVGFAAWDDLGAARMAPDLAVRLDPGDPGGLAWRLGVALTPFPFTAAGGAEVETPYPTVGLTWLAPGKPAPALETAGSAEAP